MRNPLTSLSSAAARSVEASASIPIASAWKLPISSSPIFRQANAEIQMNTVRTSGTVHSIVHRISSDVARQRFAMFLEADGRGTPVGGERQIPDHAFLRVWERPNETMTPTSRAFLQLAGSYLELLGEAAILVVTMGNIPGGQPVELWPIRPDRLAPVPDPHEWLAGWVYTSEDGERVPLRPDQIIQVKYPDPLDPYRGISPLRSAMTEVDTAEFATELQRVTFENMAMPGGFLTTDAEMSPNDFRIWVERWNEQHQGVSNAGRVSLMDRGGKFVAQQMSMVDMQLVELVQSNRGNIREAWGISKTILGQNEDVNRATAIAAEQIYGRYTLTDRVDLWLEAGNELVRRFGSARSGPGRRSRYRVEVDGPLTPIDVEIDAKDRDSRAKWALEFIKAGADVDETLEHFGFPGFGWDEERLTASIARTERPGLPAAGDESEVLDGEPLPELAPG